MEPNVLDLEVALFPRAERLLPKYGDVAWLALHQACLLLCTEGLDVPYNEELLAEFEKWRLARAA